MKSLIRSRIPLLAVLLALVIAGMSLGFVSRTAATAPVKEDVMALEGPTWTLTNLDGTAPHADSTPTLRFEEGRVSGSGSVNRFFGGYTLDDGKLTIGGIGATRMAGPPELMQQENSYFAALESASSYHIQDGTLEIVCDGSTLTFMQA